MAKKNIKTKHHKLEHRDWVTILLAIFVVATNWVWYQHVKTQEMTDRNQASSWLMQQVQINKLKACIDENTRPCDITPPQE